MTMFVEMMKRNDSKIIECVKEKVVAHMELAMMHTILGEYNLSIEHILKAKTILYQYMMNIQMYKKRLSCVSLSQVGTLFVLPNNCLELIKDKL